MTEHRCVLPGYMYGLKLGRKFLCPVCNTEWVRERYARYRVWTAVRPNGKKERR